MADEARFEIVPHNLYARIRGHGSKNGFRALSQNLYNWMQMHPTVSRGAAMGTAVGAPVYLAEKA
jgi:hypothetical protein